MNNSLSILNTIKTRNRKRNTTNNYPLPASSVNNDFNMQSSYCFHPIEPIDKSLKKNYLYLNQTMLKHPRIKRYQSVLCTQSTSILQKRSKVFYIKFSKEDKKEIHNKAEEFSKVLLNKRHYNQQYKGEVDALSPIQTKKRMLSINHINTMISKENNSCLMLKSIKEQIKCCGDSDDQQNKLKILQNLLSERKYSTVNVLQRNDNDQLANYKDIKKEYKESCFDSNNKLYNTNPEYIAKLMKKKIWFQFFANKSIPKDFTIKKSFGEFINEHKSIVNQINGSIANTHKVILKIKNA